MTENSEAEGTVLSGMIWMLALSVLLFWLPGFGSLIAGAVGGFKAGGAAKGLLAATLPAIALSIALFTLATVLTTLPVIGLVTAMGGFMVTVIYVMPMIIGAIVGGLFA